MDRSRSGVDAFGSEREAEMIDWQIFAPMLIVYLLGAATPIFFAGVIFNRIGDEDGGCLFSMILATIVLLILLILYTWISTILI